MKKADVAKLVDASDSKSDAAHPVCRFESGHRHHKPPIQEVFYFMDLLYNQL